MFFTEDDKIMHGTLCKNAYSLRDLLNADKNKKGYEQTHAKEYYAATILEEAIKFLTSVIRWEDDFKDGFDKEKENTLVGNLIIQGLYNEINLYHRKLLESLVNLFLWIPLADDKYVEYYYLIKEYNSLKSELLDLQEFYGIEPQRNKNKILDIENKIATVFPLIDESKCFFLNLSKRPELISGLSVHRIETSLKYRLKEALKTTDNLGKILIGFTYDNYSFASGKVHFSTELDNQSSEIITTTIRFMFAIISKVTVLCAQWLGVGDLKEFKRVDEVLSRIPNVPAWYSPLLKDIYDIDDYVYTQDGKLGRIIEKITSQYGYRAYKIHFLDDNDADIPEDYFPAQYFKRIQPKQELYDMCFKARPEFKKLYDANPDEEQLKSCLDASIKMLWNLGLKNRLLNKS
jgi:hypothetical protein